MPIIFSLIFSILLGIGFFFLGFVIINFLGLKETIKKISGPEYQYSAFGIAAFLFILYPIFFLGFIKPDFFKYLSYILIFLSFLAIYHFKSFYILQVKYFFEKKSYLKKSNLYFLFILLYFFLSLGPITSGDSLSYHTDVAKHVFLQGEFPRFSFDFNSYLSGIGEFLNAFALSINAFQFTSFVHFLGLVSILGIIKKLLVDNSINEKDAQFIYLLVLACPVLIFLISSSKPQFFYTALIFFCYSSLVSLDKFSSLKEKYLIIIISVIFSSVAVAAKISFSISFFIIFLNYFFLIKKKSSFYLIIVISILLFTLFILPSLLWKQNLYNYSFYYFLFNPFPMNIPGMDQALFLTHNYDTEGFPLSIIFPLSSSKLTLFLGFGFSILFFFLNKKIAIKKIYLFNIIFFLIIMSYFGQRSPRFYLEIYLFFILIFVTIYKDILHSTILKYLKFLIYLQSLFVLILLVYGVFALFPGSLTKKLMDKILSENASGYDLYNWVNKSIPKNSSIIVYDFKGTYTIENKNFYLDFINYVNFDDKEKKNFWLLKLKQNEPDYILFYGKKNNFTYGMYNFKDCVQNLFAFQKNVSFYATRNPFNRKRELNDGFIYEFNFKKLPNCVTRSIK